MYRLLDLFSGAGGAASGYAKAGFKVTGVDIVPQPNYHFPFFQADALCVLHDASFLYDFDIIHASPPCQAYSDLQRRSRKTYPRLIEPVRDLLIKSGLPYIIENVEGAPLLDPIMLCGTMFPGLRVLRHRLFESSLPLLAPPHPRGHPPVFTYDKRKKHYATLDQNTSFVQVTGGGNCTVANALGAMGITHHMTKAEVNEAIPPAYTDFLGTQIAGVVPYR